MQNVFGLNDIDWSESIKEVKAGLGNQLVRRAYPLTPQDWELSMDYMTFSNTNTIGRKCGRVTFARSHVVGCWFK
jgi:hypothetical protein